MPHIDIPLDPTRVIYEVGVTEMVGDGMAIDPDTCGCTDCLIGNSRPLDMIDVGQFVHDLLVQRRPIFNRTGRPLTFAIGDIELTLTTNNQLLPTAELLPATTYRLEY